MDKQRKWFLKTDSTPGEDAVKTVDMTTKHSEYSISSVDTGAAGFERTDSSFVRNLTVGKTLSNSTACYRKVIPEKKSQSTQHTLLSCFKNLSESSNSPTTTALISWQPATLR